MTGRRRLIALVLGALGIAAAGCASTTGGSQLQADVDALQQQVWKLQKDNAALSQQVAQAGAVSAPAAPDQSAAELRARLDTVAREVQVLRTRADESDQRLSALADELRAARETLETIARAQSAQAAQSAPGDPAQAPPTAAAPGGVPGGADLYRQGYSDYARGNFDRALLELEEFIRLHPADDLADDAQYLVGEVYFSQQKYPEAVGAYDRLLKDQAAGERAASAYLKKGLALLEMNRTADAVIQLQHVVTAYPKSEEARIARERLRALGLRER
jgi:tol-pal system protein YbgF